MIYKPFSVVTVPFPFSDANQHKRRPALVISPPRFQQKNGHAMLAMITSAKQSSWWGDHIILDRTTAGLPTPSLIRQKMFTLDIRLIIEEIGELSPDDQAQFVEKIRVCLDW